MKRCPPGVLCVENVTLFLMMIIFIVLGYLVYINIKENKNSSQTETINIKQNIQEPNRLSTLFELIPSWPYTNLPKDVLLNPYDAPYRDERYLIPEVSLANRNSVPINISTNVGAVDTTYRQLGMLTPLNGSSKDTILPLMGRPLFTGRDKWQYYTISNQHNNIKLPISFKGRSALTDYGVDKIFSSDTVYVEGYNDAFKATVYENDTIKYLPFL